MRLATPARAGAALGLRLPPACVPTISWSAWTVVDRTHGFHVSRESAGGTAREFLRNEVGDVKVFRKHHLAATACAAANFSSTAETLSAEPLLGGSGS
jgi:hypothetical protein